LNIEKRVVRVHLAGKHALEFEMLDIARQTVDIGFDLFGSLQIGFLGCKVDELRGIVQSALQFVETVDDLFELRTLFTQFLRALRLVPDPGLFEFAGYFLKALVLVVVIKDTSSRNRYVPRDL